MNDPIGELGAWADTPVRERLVDFLRDLDGVAPVDRVALFDNDGTLWVERPHYVQERFIRHSFEQRVADDSEFVVPDTVTHVLGEGPEVMSEYDLHDVAKAFNSVFEGWTPDEFDRYARAFIESDVNERFGRPHLTLRYRPMLQLLDALRARGCDCFVVTGGGSEFVRSISWPAYQVTPDRVVGTMVDYDVETESGVPVLKRRVEMPGDANEGAAKVKQIQLKLGRRPIFAAGNSAGDREMLDYAQATDGPSLALLIDHDDDEREVAYRSVAASFADDRDIVDIGNESGWLVASMRHDWTTIF